MRTFKKLSPSPTSVAQLVGRHPGKGKVTSLVDSRSGHTPALQVPPWLECTQEATH